MNYDNKIHERSRELALKEVAARMAGKRSALLNPSLGIDAMALIYSCLEHMGTLLPQEDQEKFYGTAIELLPIGSCNAQACFPPKEPPFVLLDSGTIDFAGCMSTIILTLVSQSRDDILFPLASHAPQFSHSSSTLTEQDVIDYLYGAAFIYYSQADQWQNSLDAIYTPKLNYSMVSENMIRPCLDVSLAIVLFFVCHEIGHVMTDNHKGFSEIAGLPQPFQIASNWEKQFSENIADAFAIDLLINYSIRWADRNKVKYLLAGIDFGFSCMHFMQSAFPYKICNVDGEKVILINESLSHPSALFRRAYYRDVIKKYRLEDFIKVSYDWERTLAEYAHLIQQGRVPSRKYLYLRELIKSALAADNRPKKTTE